MVSQGIPLPPPAANQQTTPVANAAARSGPLVLSTPASHIAYQIHPGVPLDHQRIEVSGYVADGTSWTSLRLMVDGQILAEAQNASRLRAWWQFTPGNHTFWLEGTRFANGELVQTEPAFVIVQGSTAMNMTSSSN
jgi:hypothetical protein